MGDAERAVAAALGDAADELRVAAAELGALVGQIEEVHRVLDRAGVPRALDEGVACSLAARVQILAMRKEMIGV